MQVQAPPPQRPLFLVFVLVVEWQLLELLVFLVVLLVLFLVFIFVLFLVLFLLLSPPPRTQGQQVLLPQPVLLKTEEK